MNDINTVIFDIGNVLADFEWEIYAQTMLPNISPDELRLIESAIWTHGLWNEFDIGLMSDEEIISGFISYAPDYEREIRLLCDEKNIGGCISRLDTSIPWINHVKNSGRKVLFLSNYSKIIMRANPGALDFLPFMDGGIFSCDVHLIKPDLKIYETLIKKYDLTPQTCVFIDDIEANIKAARECGLNAIKCLNYEQARAELDECLGIK